MSQRKIVVANWKMNLAGEEGAELAKKIKAKLAKKSGQVAVVLCPSFPDLTAVKKVLEKTNIELGAQNVFWQGKGAFTGEISPRQIRAAGCRYVIVGHSERRQYLGETDEMVNKKVLAALEAGLKPIICVGETLDEKMNQQAEAVIFRQLSAAIEGVELTGKEELIISYEPVWAIGTGQVIEPADAERAFRLMRQILIDHFPKSIAANIKLLYGGSVDAENAPDFRAVELLDGFLVGGASLDVDKFTRIIESLN